MTFNYGTQFQKMTAISAN